MRNPRVRAVMVSGCAPWVARIMTEKGSPRGFGPLPGPVQDVSVEHGGADVGVAEKLLHGADVVVVLEKMGGEGVAERMAAHSLGDGRAAGRQCEPRAGGRIRGGDGGAAGRSRDRRSCAWPETAIAKATRAPRSDIFGAERRAVRPSRLLSGGPADAGLGRHPGASEAPA